MRSIQATPQYIPFILRNSDMAYSKSSGSWPYLERMESYDPALKGQLGRGVEWWVNDKQAIKLAPLKMNTPRQRAYFAMNPACWSRRREVGALWGMSASFTITAIVTSTLKCRDRRFKLRNTSMSFQNLRYPRQWIRYRIGNQNSSLKLAWVFMCLVPLPLFLLLPPWKRKCNFTTDILDRMNQSLHLGCMSHDHISPFQPNQFLGSVMPTIERCKHKN